ncbi:MAG: C4-dicarboxylate TRAP transporter substrate-binding protein [Alphaproteobacteria bacterium]|nr:C4-dicarboxylate TRAP transporter substrate-binding protein [Alphaproteobacteria bacterium]
MIGYKSKHALAAAAAVVSALAITASTAPANAQETIKLALISGYPPLTSWTGAAVETFIPKIAESLAKSGNFKIEWNIAISGQVVRATGELEGIEAGVGDVGIVVTAAEPSKAPLYAVSFNTPFTTLDMTLLSDTMKTLADKFPAYDAGWDKFNQVSLQPASAVDNMMIWTKKKVTKLTDLKGMKIGAIGPNLRWVQAVGAIGVNTDLVRAYSALSTGVFTGAIFWPAAAGQFKICEPAPYALEADIGAVSGFALNVNKDVWNGLPDEVKNAFIEAAPLWKTDNIARVKKVTGIMVNRCTKKFGTEFTKLSDAERSQWANSLPSLGKEWAEQRNKAGEPGTEILKTYMDAMRAANQPIARHWDRE